MGRVLERHVGSFTRWKSVKAFGAWGLFVSLSCKLLDASAQTQADSPAHGSAQVRPGLSPSLALRRVFPGGEQACTLGTRSREAGGARRWGIKSREVSCGLGGLLAPESRGQRGSPRAPLGAGV